MPLYFKQLILLPVFVCAAMFDAASAADAVYPARPVRMLVGFTPGGTSDVVARIVSKKLSEAWGQQFVVDNRAGAAGILAAELTARAVPDGHTLFFVSSSFAMQPSATPKLP
jgi:tripartite-type tricarboxylate transporter receptor subunit TctC